MFQELKILRRRFALFGISLLSFYSTGQEIPEILEIKGKSGDIFEKIIRYADVPEPDDCENKVRWGALKIKILNRARDYEKAVELYNRISSTCPNLLTAGIFFERGVSQYYLDDFSGCIESMKSYIRLLPEEYYNLRRNAYLNIGSAFNQLDQLDSALHWYDLSYLDSPEKASGMLLNNMASIKMKQSKYNDALHYLHLAEKKTTASSPAYIQDLIQYNFLETYRCLNKLRDAQAIYNQLDRSVLPRGSEEMGVSFLFYYSLSVDDTASFLAIGKMHSSKLLEWDHPHAAKLLELYNTLVNSNPKATLLWTQLKTNIAPKITSDEGGTESVIDEQLASTYQNWRMTAIGLIAVILIAVFWGTWLWWRKIHASRLIDQLVADFKKDLSANSDVEDIRLAIEGKGSVKKALEALVRMDYQLSLLHTSTKQYEHIPWERFDATEIEVIKLLLARKSVPEIAALRGCSAGHIYNVKSSIRKKLKLPSETRALEKFLLQGM